MQVPGQAQWIHCMSNPTGRCSVSTTQCQVAATTFQACATCRFVQSNAYKSFLERGHKIKYNEFGTARPALQSLPIIASGILGIGQGMILYNNSATQPNLAQVEFVGGDRCIIQKPV